MSDTALESQGTALYIDTGGPSPTVWTQITNCRDINFRTGAAAVKDVTDLSSSAKEKRMGLPDEGQCTFTLQYQPKLSDHKELADAKADRQIRDFKLVLTDAPTPTTFYFSGFVLQVPINIGIDGVVESQVVVEISGAVHT